MGHEGHPHHEEKPLSFFASPLLSHSANQGHAYAPAETHHSHTPSIHSSNDLEHQKTADTTHVPFQNTDCDLHDSPSFHRHAEATTAELFYDLFFVANLTTFTSVLEINDKNSLTAYIGFFSLLWLTWYQVSLYDVRFSSDSVFERAAKAIHFGVMVGFAVIGPQWKPGQELPDYDIYRAFGLILMVSRFTLFAQYAVTLYYTRQYKKTIVPILAIMGSTLVAAILYGALTPVFPKDKTALDQYGEPYFLSQKSEAYIAWYVIGLSETLVTVCVSCIWRVISFKGTHMVQRMSLLTLIILGEGIIVICKSISKIVKNEFLWTAAVVGQVIAAVLIIYFLYMLYFDRMQEEHFGSIKQQIWSFGHFPLHTVLVLVLQGVSLLIIWTQAVSALNYLATDIYSVADHMGNLSYANGSDLAYDLNYTLYANVYWYIPKGVDVSTEEDQVYSLMFDISDSYDYVLADQSNETAIDDLYNDVNEVFALSVKSLFDTFSVSLPKDKSKKKEDKALDVDVLFAKYVGVFDLVFQYVFISGGLALILITVMGFLSLPGSKRKPSEYARLGINGACGLGLTLISLLKYNANLEGNFLASTGMIPTLMAVYFLCVLANHVRIPGRNKAH
ncbi:hypothetical protein K491DRAFT_723245 [Lophiostoma macrostomum CBS 122681]|uniref:Low temperature requirement A n=1 Tax=Lophiostoma macrostomum CBS 122681 TaxID=1314788 RepID=A0A6A6SIS7_9PLEO|nr:hypothetical protein K491DRAFT_723245 [Lophiostoma macrostomum CBS 122681]